jgi:integration host factor subunit beta
MADHTVTRADLAEEIARSTGLHRTQAEEVVEVVLDRIISALKEGDKVEIRGFGSFRTRQRRPRKGRNPKTGTAVPVPAKRVPYFKPSKELKSLVNSVSEASPGTGIAPSEPAPSPAG